jgi:hypothetical protein
MFNPRCSRKKRTGESREKNADASVTEQRSRQQRRPVVHAVKHRSTLRTNTDVSVRSAEKCTLTWNEVRKRNCSSWSVRELNAGLITCLDQRRHGSARTCSLHCTLTPAACAARSARSVPGQDTRSGQGALARRHTDGPLWAALLKTTVMCEAWRRRTIAPPDPSRTADRPKPNSPYNWVLDTDTGTGPIPPITVSKVNAYSGGVLARALPEGLRYLST